MNEDKFRELIELADPEGKIPDGVREEIINSLSGRSRSPTSDMMQASLEDVLRKQMLEEPPSNWRLRAARAAKIISLGLE